MKKAPLTGITEQDGSYLAKLLLDVRHDSRYERPSEVDLLIGDPVKLKRQIGWEPKVKFKELVRIMTEADLELARRELAYQNAGSGSDDSLTSPWGEHPPRR